MSQALSRGNCGESLAIEFDQTAFGAEPKIALAILMKSVDFVGAESIAGVEVRKICPIEPAQATFGAKPQVAGPVQGRREHNVARQTIFLGEVFKAFAIEATHTTTKCAEPQIASWVFQDAGDLGLGQPIFDCVGSGDSHLGCGGFGADRCQEEEQQYAFHDGSRYREGIFEQILH